MIRIGKIVATHGLDGALVLTHVVGAGNWLKKGDVLHVEMQKGSYIPYFITQVKATKPAEFIVSLEEVAKVETAKRLVARPVYVDEKLLAAYARQSPLLWIGFSIIDAHHGDLGPVDDVMQSGHQWIARAIYKGTEVLIPLIEEFIKELDLKGRRLKVDLPEGLLEIYL